MCGRFTLYLTHKDLLGIFQVDETLSIEPRYNISPSQEVLAIREEEKKRHLVRLRWGLIPFWADDPKIAYRTINARSETAHKTPSFRSAFKNRRCLIPASGFYEWKREGKTKQPFYIRRKDGQPMAFAGLWEHWEDRDHKEKIESCTILTTNANPEVSRLHDRMPVILEPENFDLWLDPEENRQDKLQVLLKPADDGLLSLRPVSKYVNSPSNEGEKCVEKNPLLRG
ncbi:MAG: SOS response-associated peptidase [Deltaproteobacteria bacterium]|nr:SOS response-associated peptidase [Deltaproteobacteria bacterium]